MSDIAQCWINGEVIPAQQASVSVFDHGFLYGDGIFEGIRFYNKRVFRLPLHMARLKRSARALQLEIPLDDASFEEAIYATINAFPLADGYLRVLVTRGVGALGINPANCAKPAVIIIADKLTMVGDEERNRGIRAIIAATRRMTPDRLDPRIKSLNYLNAIQAKMEANYAGVEEAILLNERGFVTEGSAMNIFVVREGAIHTPPAIEGALQGVTRGTVLEVAKELGIPAFETVLTSYDLFTADECFFTGTGAKLIPIREIDGRKMASCPGAIYLKLLAGFNALVARETAG